MHPFKMIQLHFDFKILDPRLYMHVQSYIVYNLFQGGFPAWLLQKNGSIVLRTMDPGESDIKHNYTTFNIVTRPTSVT